MLLGNRSVPRAEDLHVNYASVGDVVHSKNKWCFGSSGFKSWWMVWNGGRRGIFQLASEFKFSSWFQWTRNLNIHFYNLSRIRKYHRWLKRRRIISVKNFRYLCHSKYKSYYSSYLRVDFRTAPVTRNILNFKNKSFQTTGLISRVL